MTGIELFIWILLVIGWVLFQVVRRVLKPPRPLGKIEDAADAQSPGDPAPVPAPRKVLRPVPVPSREAPLDVDWGRTPEASVPEARLPPAPRMPPPARPTPPARLAPVPRAVAEEPFAWSADPGGAELALARELGRRQAERRRAAAPPVRLRHPYRPRLRTARDLHAGVVMQAVLGPCRAFDPWEPPDRQP